MLAKNLGCDGVISHHPAGGTALLEGYKVFQRHVDQMTEAGVPRDIAEEAISPKYHQLEVQHHPDNYDQTPSAAKKLGLALLTIHSPCDEIGRKILVKHTKSLGESRTVGQLATRIRQLPEYKKAETNVEVRLGSAKNKIGRLAVSHAAYTNGGYDVAKAYYNNGVGTITYIHISDADLTRLRADGKGNMLVLGHIASDWLGINPVLREIEKAGVETIPTTDLA